MSRQNGATSSLSSTLETTHGTPSTTSSPHPSVSTVEGNTANSTPPSSIDLSSKTSCSTGTVRGKVQIPKLSAATTELLARIAGNIRGDQQNNDSFTTRWGTSTFDPSLNSLNFQKSNTMKASSTIIELPTAPFAYTNKTWAPTAVSNQAPITSGDSSSRPKKPVAIAPKPSVTVSAGPPATLAPSQIQQTLPSQPTALIPKPPVATSAPSQIQSTFPSQPTGLIPKAPLASLAPKTAKVPGGIPQKATPGPRSRKNASNGSRKSRKRRRGGDSDGEDIIRAGDSSSDESDVAPTATQTKSGRQVNRPSLYVPPVSSPAVTKANGTTSHGSETTVARRHKRVFRKTKEAYVNCTHCQRGHSPQSNAIVFCDGYSDVVNVVEKEWHCRECKPVQISIVQPTVVRSNPDLRAQTFGHPLQHHVPCPEIEVGGERFSAEERRGYLSSLSHASLVELLVTISDRHPSLSMFPSNLKELQSSKFLLTSNTSAGPVSEAPSTQTLTTTETPVSHTEKDTASEKPSTENTEEPLPSASSSRKRHRYESDEESEYEEFQEHRLYPRAGNGFRLSLNVDDIDIMREDPACPTFSYALHGPAKARAEANETAPVWGAA
ncbi:putative PHD finger domain protein [Aspergillus novofumigatus IBT 16806]|uniref:Putative PHD finger domain protein n=1 Tax=Aspergillus novofumigatus (strain IBT 16806) TaxID=1392255 RepID=A0A2I1CAJ5_ASPN1|nr:putative PHD finger domain protein [Aspergillus novofumigatus IBT 16806]PKX94650.1 putative PHD finger domain protein [Aspergillus novofumigatus IBT 16806]